MTSYYRVTDKIHAPRTCSNCRQPIDITDNTGREPLIWYPGTPDFHDFQTDSFAHKTCRTYSQETE